MRGQRRDQLGGDRDAIAGFDGATETHRAWRDPCTHTLIPTLIAHTRGLSMQHDGCY